MYPHLIEPLDALLFDMDGTLVDTNEAVERCWTSWAKDHDIDIRRILEICHGRQAKTTIAAIAPHLDLKAATQDLLERELSETRGVKPIPGAPEFLASLGDMPWTVVTSAARPLALHRLKLAGLPVPEHTVTAEDVENGKPDPSCFLLGAKRLGSAPVRTLVLEDSLAGLEAGRLAGMPTLQICHTHPPVDPKSPQRMRNYRGASIKALNEAPRGVGRVYGMEVQLLGC